MNTIHTILHPTDFSRCAGLAFRTACALARDAGASLVVLHVLEPVRLSGSRMNAAIFCPSKRERREALQRLRARERDIFIEPVMRKGIPAEVILALTREIPCDLIVMGLQGNTGEGLSGAGRVATAVVRSARCPVLGVKLPLAAATPFGWQPRKSREHSANAGSFRFAEIDRRESVR